MTDQPFLRRACILDCGHVVFGDLAIGSSVICPDHKAAHEVVEERTLWSDDDRA